MPNLRSLSSPEELVLHEAEILRTIQATTQTTELFLASPTRFLREQGYVLDDALAERLGMTGTGSPELYDAIERGEGRLFAKLDAAITVNVISLGLHMLFGKDAR